MSTQRREAASQSTVLPIAPVDPTPARYDPYGLEALAAAYRNHSTAVYGLACRICGPEVAAEVTRDVFIHLGRHPDGFDRARGSLRAHLLTITRDTALDFACAGSSSSPSSDELDQDEDLGPGSPNVRMADALAGLQPHERAAIETTFYGRCTYRDAAAVLGRPEETVRSSIGAGMRRLRRTLDGRSAPPQLAPAPTYRNG